MSDLIIAPTIDYSKRRTTSVQLEIPIDQVVQDVNTVPIKEKIVPMMPQHPVNVPKQAQNKRLINTTAIKNGSADIDAITRQRFEYEQITQNKNMTYFPTTSIVNGQVIGGTINNDMR